MWARITSDVAVSANPKCGCMSLKQFGRLRLTCEQVAGCRQRVLFIREPMERFYSAYCYFRMVHDKGGSYKPLDLSQLQTYEAFTDMTFTLEDRHWGPQVDNCQSYTEVRRWDGLPAFVEQVAGVPLQRTNSSPHYPADMSYRRDELLARYAQDYALLAGLPIPPQCR